MQGTEWGTWAKREKDLHHPHPGPPEGEGDPGHTHMLLAYCKTEGRRVIHYNNFNLTLNVTST